MRRGFSIFLILLFGVGPLSAVLDASSDSNLPACCRRQGKHHCAMTVSLARETDQTSTGATPSFTAPPGCPLFPGFITGPLTPAHALTASGADLPALLEQLRAIASIATDAPQRPTGTHASRGPPVATQPDKVC